ncbi:uncharacterized protein ATNIH1004_001523 [Aspergillus tanneri]|uniref:Uncharacterized protein n=1 Tax=Aspergillus tanneri TaxID=1220188 RepID=A0A5M9N0J5_9EURO|nr:uncharacterized protein ATNIH1004_001523 [Aspergillus tanneri]KAA8652618.1 hypothetical protein ATNIH1004_001523 [Aspergillus tanneri]
MFPDNYRAIFSLRMEKLAGKEGNETGPDASYPLTTLVLCGDILKLNRARDYTWDP